MDGLREDAEIVFILTTNRPGELEPALADRPGRIDQSVEFSLPDAEARRKLARLYARGLDPSEDLIATVADRTEGASGAFIKELMRRSAQALLRRDAARLEIGDVRTALEEMLFSGGAVNVGILGGNRLASPPPA